VLFKFSFEGLDPFTHAGKDLPVMRRQIRAEFTMEAGGLAIDFGVGVLVPADATFLLAGRWLELDFLNRHEERFSVFF
jgi:hypothetical protein